MILLILISYFLLLVSANENESSNDLQSRVPPPLTLSNFDNTLLKGFHMVEFYSPYCHHCQNLFPTWVEFYESNPESSGYAIHQVDCVVSGDLCDREGIRYFPMIRFYGPNSKLLASMTSSSRTIDTLNEFANEQLLIWNEEGDSKFNEDDFVGLQNSMIDNSELRKVLSGDLEVPKLISFWPTSNDQLNDSNFQNKYNAHAIFKNSENLYNFRNIWNFVIRNLHKFGEEHKLEFHYVNCKSNAALCGSLGFSELLNSNLKNLTPRIVLYLPKSNGNSLFLKPSLIKNRKFNHIVKFITNWTYRNLINSELQDLKINDIKNFIGATTKLKDKNDISDIPNYSKVAFIQVNDPNTQVLEDDIILDHLLQPVADLDSEVYLFKSTDKDGALKLLQDQERNLIDYIKIDEQSLQDKISEKLFISRTRSTFPMFIALKSSSLYTPVYQSFTSKEIRDTKKVLSFIRSNYLPMINHLSDDNKYQVFPKRMSPLNSKTEKILVSITDFQPKQFFEVEFYMSKVYHKFQYLRNMKIFQKIDKQRNEKHEEVNRMKLNDATSDDIIDKLREKITESYISTDNNLFPVYLDLDTLSKVASSLNWNKLDIQKYKVGDSILISRFTGQYWDQYLRGRQLNIENIDETVNLLKDILKNKNSGKSITRQSILLTIFQVWILLLVIAACLHYYKRFQIKRAQQNEKMKGLGILGLSADSKFD